MGETQIKKCPYCAEEILAEAVKCKHCGSDLVPKGEVPGGKGGRPPLAGLLGALIFLGGAAAGLYYALIFKTYTSTFFGKINNPDLVHQRQTGIIVGLALAAIGAVMGYFGFKRK